MRTLLMAGIIGGAFVFTAAEAVAHEQVHAAGSSTVYPFVTAAAEQFGKKSGSATPIVESTGTGGGFKLFCAGDGHDTIDIANASRAIEPSEREQCAKNGVKAITELKIGYDGIALANALSAAQFKLTKAQIFLALAKQIPVGGKLVDNPHQKWNEIDPALPAIGIKVYGPPPTSGTRDAFVELVMEPSCVKMPEVVAAYPDEIARKKACHLLREDGKYVEAGENDNLIIQKLHSDTDALGIFGFSYLEQNKSVVQGSLVEGIAPSFEAVSKGTYPISRPLFVYVKNTHLKEMKNLKPFLQELVSDAAIGDEGYAVEKGLIPLKKDELLKTQAAVKALE